jgi:hypothetical protein
MEQLGERIETKAKRAEEKFQRFVDSINHD